MVTASQAITDLRRFQEVYEQSLVNYHPEISFSELVAATDWENQPLEMYHAVIDMAITLGMSRLAYQLAQQGHLQYPDDDPLKKVEYVLAPAKAIQLDLPPVPSLAHSMKWLKEHAQDYRGMWVAVLKGELLETASSYPELVELVGETAKNPELLVTQL